MKLLPKMFLYNGRVNATAHRRFFYLLACLECCYFVQKVSGSEPPAKCTLLQAL